MPDGRRIADVPEFNKKVQEWARAGGGDILETGEAGAGTSLEARRAEIKKIMETDYRRYSREGLAKEYEEILGKLESRGKLDAA